MTRASGRNGDLEAGIVDKLDRVLALLESSQSESQSMSKATADFSTGLLQGLGITWSRKTDNKESGEIFEFDWGGGEEANTFDAGERLMKLLNICGFEFLDVRKFPLSILKAGNKSSSGQADGIIRPLDTLDFDDRSKFGFGIGIIEFKTKTKPLNFYQQLLELVSFSRMSGYEQAVVLLGTDLSTKWQVMYFQSRNIIACQSFKHGSVALPFFKDLLAAVDARATTLKPVPSVAEAGQGSRDESLDSAQDLTGFLAAHASSVKFGADDIQFLQNFANYLNYNMGADVNLPAWVKLPDSAAGMFS
jgi:hypothetical protein